MCRIKVSTYKVTYFKKKSSLLTIDGLYRVTGTALNANAERSLLCATPEHLGKLSFRRGMCSSSASSSASGNRKALGGSQLAGFVSLRTATSAARCAA